MAALAVSIVSLILLFVQHFWMAERSRDKAYDSYHDGVKKEYRRWTDFLCSRGMAEYVLNKTSGQVEWQFKKSKRTG